MNFDSDTTSDDQSTGIDLTSMIDVLFVLVLFFMVTTTFADTSSIDVNLPAASAKSSKIEKKDVTVALTEDGKIYVNENAGARRELALSDLTPELKRLEASGADLSILLRADKKVEHGTVVAVLDHAKEAGIEKIAIATVVDALQ